MSFCHWWYKLVNIYFAGRDKAGGVEGGLNIKAIGQLDRAK